MMHYLPIFEPGRAQFVGTATVRYADIMLNKRAIFLSASGDSVVFQAHGRQVGLVFFRHPWSGRVIVKINGTVHEAELYSAESRHWVCEFDLPPSGLATIQVESMASRSQAAQGMEVWLEAAYVSDYRTCEVPELIAQRVAASPLAGLQINQLTDVFKWYDYTWRDALARLACSPDYVPPDFVHRKAWEWAQCVYGLEVLGAIRPDHRALGVGVGWEPLSYFFANLVDYVVATDLYPVKSHWSETGAREGDPEILENPDKYAPFPYRCDRIAFKRMDGKRLEFPDESFDFVWSCSSIEHFGGHTGAAMSMREIGRVLKPGGVAAIITEYVLPDPDTRQHALFDAEYFNLRHLYEYLVRPASSLRLVQNIDFSIPDYYVRRVCRLPEEAVAPHQGINKPHIVLRSPSGALHTSVALFFRKEA
jgi:SAM-dependent methyltransferase